METITSLINRIDPSARIDGEQIILSTDEVRVAAEDAREARDKALDEAAQ